MPRQSKAITGGSYNVHGMGACGDKRIKQEQQSQSSEL